MNHQSPRLSAIIIAKNEASRIAKCLESVTFCDEIIVVDSGSTDDTAQIAQKQHAIVISVKSGDFSELRNLGKQSACGQWVLYVDADEIVTPELACAIRNASTKDYYYIHRVNYYLGHRWPGFERMPRLFRNNALKEWRGELHETPEVSGDWGELNGELLHFTHRTLEEMVEKTNIWSATEATLRYDAGHPPVVWWRLLRVMLTGFSNSFFRQQGWRAGTIGLIESIYQAFSMFITYSKLWELQQKEI